MGTLTKDAVLEDITRFQDVLENRFSYFFLEHGDYLQALNEIREHPSELDRNTLGNLLQKVLEPVLKGRKRSRVS